MNLGMPRKGLKMKTSHFVCYILTCIVIKLHRVRQPELSFNATIYYPANMGNLLTSQGLGSLDYKKMRISIPTSKC